jgi:hypothetical protein
MNIRQMAMMNVAKLIGSAVAMGVVVNLGIHYFGIAIVGTVVALGVLAYMCKFAYDIELSKLEHLNTLKKIKDTQ